MKTERWGKRPGLQVRNSALSRSGFRLPTRLKGFNHERR
jgi:hypothetical protein